MARKQVVMSALYARIVLRTVCAVHPRCAAIWEGRWLLALASRIWQRRNSKASRERRPFSRRCRRVLDSGPTYIGGFIVPIIARAMHCKQAPVKLH